MEENRYIHELSIVMPCRNEASTVAVCVEKAREFLQRNKIDGEVIVADNDSADGSSELAEKAGAKVVHVKHVGYGSALSGGINAAQGQYVIIGDSDNSYDFLEIYPFLEKLREGYQLVMGNRFLGEIKPGAMPWHHKYLGNPMLTKIGKIFFNKEVGDFHCGLRGFTKEAYDIMDMQTTGMEFASEMVIKASLYNMSITEIPVTLSKDGRKGRSHLRSLRDGWRHLRFLFLYSPRWLFFYPGIALMALGLALMVFILLQPSLNWDVHTMLYASGAIMIGFQAVIFAIFTKTFAVHEKLLPSNPQIEEIFKKYTPEKGVTFGLIMALIGLLTFIFMIIIWREGTFFRFDIRITMRIVILSVTLLVLGWQLILSSFFYYLLKINTKK